MAKQTLNNGEAGLDFRTKLNDNFTELYNREEITSEEKTNIADNTTARHTHSNNTLLDSITDSGDGTKYLADDGTYKEVSGGSGSTTFKDLTDTPADYTGSAGKYAVVNATEDGLEFDTPAGSGDMTKSVYDANENGVVDDAEKVNGKTVEENVPAGAVFTDTTYTDAEIKTKLENNTDTNTVTDAEKTILSNTSGTNTGDQDLSGLALKSNVLELDNTTAFTPDTDYEPATKKYVDDNAGGGGGGIETVVIKGEQIAGTEFFEYIADGAKTVSACTIALQDLPEGADFIVECFVNGTSQGTLTIATTDTATNGRYIANWTGTVSLVANDVFTVKITQVGSDVAGNDFSFLINIS